ncbi:MAG: hypothetical protein AB1Z23_02085 [Eubacteriales bacterium]
MMKKTILFLAVLFALAVPAVHANDGGAYPDYNKYITYTVETDCTEIGIGEELTFTITVKNHTPDTFRPFYGNNIFRNTSLIANEEWCYLFKGIYVEPYAKSTFEMKVLVGEDVWWYETDGSYYIDLCPTIMYSLYADSGTSEEKYGGTGLFINMVGVEPIPIRLNNLHDGSHLVDFGIIDENTMVLYSDTAETEAFTYMGEYEAYIRNYVSIKNISNSPIRIGCIDGYEREFKEIDYDYFLPAGQSIVAKITERRDELPKLITETEHVELRALFTYDNSEYYFVNAQRDYKVILDNGMPEMEIRAVSAGYEDDKYALFNIEVTNISDEDIDDFFIYYGEEFPESRDQLYGSSLKKPLHAGETIALGEPIKIDILNITDEYMEIDYYRLRIGHWAGNMLYYCIVNIDGSEVRESDIYTSSDFSYMHQEDVFNLMMDEEIFSLNDEMEKANATPTPFSSETPDITIAPSATPTSNVSVEKVRSYYISPFIFALLGFAAAAAAAMVIISRRKDKGDSEEK